jgi:hypothetical protein
MANGDLVRGHHRAPLPHGIADRPMARRASPGHA